MKAYTRKKKLTQWTSHSAPSLPIGELGGQGFKEKNEKEKVSNLNIADNANNIWCEMGTEGGSIKSLPRAVN